MKHEVFELDFLSGKAALHRIHHEDITSSESSSKGAVFLVHGYFEDSRIFYSASGKGFAPFLAEQGYDVYMCDLLGKGKSTPKASEGLDQNQHEIIMHDLPKYIKEVRDISGYKDIHIGGHSWGGVIALAFLARTKDTNIKSYISFGSKRRIGVKGWRKIVFINFGWNWYGERLVKKHGYLPADKMRMGNEDEPGTYYLDAAKWVRETQWIDPTDGFDYHNNFDFDLPPMLFITGRGDKILGHPKDVKRLMKEVAPSEATYKVIGKDTGHLHNYDHINLLTHKDAPKDHFKLVLNFLEKFN